MHTENQRCDVLIYGATPAGIACSVTAAREGLKVCLVNYRAHIGGMLSNGLGVWDTLYEKGRSPVYDALRTSIFEAYRRKYGSNSAQYLDSLPGNTGHSNGTFEPGIAEESLNDMIRTEKDIYLHTGYYPVSATVEDNLVRSVEFADCATGARMIVLATFTVDCTYEGDLMPLVGLPYRVGRESRSEYDEPHAGRIFMRNLNGMTYNKGLDLRKFGNNQSVIYPESTGEGDNNIQAFNLRTVLTSDPANRIGLTRPDDYDPDQVRDLDYNSVIGLPNQKVCWNRPQLIGTQYPYVEGSWDEREEIIVAHKKATLALLYFLQNDRSVSSKVRKYWKGLGLAKDEFAENDHLPHEIYVREARRLVGEYMITQYDFMPAKNQRRTPAKYDSIATTDWYMDTHACSQARTRDSLHEGTMMLYYDTYPGQIPFRSLYNRKIRNLLVPVCLSATHVAWGAIRLEATWMNIAESAACAVNLAIRTKKWLDEIDIDQLQMELVARRIMIGFFNDFDINSDSALIPAVQYFSTKGFFGTYDLYSDRALDLETATVWVNICKSIVNKSFGSITSVASQENASDIVATRKFNSLLREKGFNATMSLSSEKMNRGQAVEFLYDLVTGAMKERQATAHWPCG